MKVKFLFGIIAALLLIWVASAFNPKKVETVTDDQGNLLTLTDYGEAAFGPNAGDFYNKAFPLDTINDAEIDYKTLPNFLSNFQMCVTLEAPAAVSGTRSLKLVLEEANRLTGTYWRAIDSLTLMSGYGLITLRKSVAECPRYRIRVSGAAIEVAPYTVILTGKKLQ